MAGRPFAAAGSPTRDRRLRRLALAALPRFGIEARRVRIIHAGHNLTLSVLDHRGRRFAVRVYRPGWRTRAAIDSELTWLRALAADTELGAPRPVGEAIEVTADGVNGPRTVAAFTWIAGSNLNRAGTATPAHARLMGETAALLHGHASTWLLPSAFERPVCRGPGLTGTLPGVEAIQDGKHRGVAELALARCLPAFDRLDAAGSPFGLVHGDVHFGNIRMTRDRARPIDFDDSCFRHHAFDLATAVHFLAQWPHGEAMTDGFLEGYSSALPLPARFEEEVEHLRAARALELVLWAASNHGEPGFVSPGTRRWIGAAMEKLEPYAAGD